MTTGSQHPMDGLQVRPLRFGIDTLGSEDLVWSRSHPRFSVFLNALGMHVPHFERYLIVALRQARPQLQDPVLLRAVSGIIGQEAHHAHNFLKINEALCLRYPELRGIDQASVTYFQSRAQRDSLKQLVGFTAGYETFTFLAGMIILGNYERWMADSQPVMKALWVWHQVEEVEHGAVAFDVYQQLYGQHEWYRKWMVIRALTHIGAETVRVYLRMARREGWLRRPASALATLGFGTTMLLRLLRAGLPTLRRGYHPRRHPLVNDRQNPIQKAWRRYAAQGGDVLSIDRGKMQAMLDLDGAAVS